MKEVAFILLHASGLSSMDPLTGQHVTFGDGLLPKQLTTIEGIKHEFFNKLGVGFNSNGCSILK